MIENVNNRPLEETLLRMISREVTPKEVINSTEYDTSTNQTTMYLSDGRVIRIAIKQIN